MENKLRKQGFSLIAGIDEAGRGAWAGPIVAAAVILPENAHNLLRNISDSKQLSEEKRQEFYDKIITAATAWSVAHASAETIDRIGIQEANKTAMVAAIRSLEMDPEVVLVDGLDLSCEYVTQKIIKGDRDVLSIAAASIIAKVTRDQIMEKFDARFPKYGFISHKGYGTREHQESLAKHGPSPLHRKSYKPIKSLIDPKII